MFRLEERRPDFQAPKESSLKNMGLFVHVPGTCQGTALPANLPARAERLPAEPLQDFAASDEGRKAHAPLIESITGVEPMACGPDPARGAALSG